jgi:hypothetical protein
MNARKASVSKELREHLRELGRKGGKKGGKARWEGVTPEERRELARKAAQARWRRTK